jgi:hypothetical protein
MSYHLLNVLSDLRTSALIAVLFCVHVLHTAAGVHAEAIEQTVIALAAARD